jgi:acyl-coenzyme A thioesterase PaaI-like protein
MDPEFSVAGKINGGYLLAVMVRAARAGLAASAPVGAGAGAGTAPPADAVEAGDGAGAGGSGGLQPVAATAHYLGAARPGPARVLVTVLHRGRSTGQVRAQLYQEQELFAEALVTFAGAGPVAARGWSDGPVVDLPPEEACFRMPVKAPGAPFEVPLMGVVDQRLDPSCLAFAMGRPPAWGSCAAGSVSRRNPPWMPSG